MIKEVEVVCPEYRGAPQPRFNPYRINESRLPDNMRFKEYAYSHEGGLLVLNWETQEPFTASDVVVFLDEIRRAFTTNRANEVLVVKLSDRDCSVKPTSYILAF